MLSKNNNRELKRKMEEKQDRFTIKKLSVGVASVLLGSFIMGTQAVQTAHASDDNTEDATVNSAQNTTMEQVVPLTASTSQSNDSQATNSAQASTAAQSTASNIASAATSTPVSSSKSEEVKTNVASTATNVSSEATKNDSNVLAQDNSQAASATMSNRALSSSLILAASATPSGATQTETPAPNKGYSVTNATAAYAKGYNANNVPLDPDPTHRTVNSYVVTNSASPDQLGENAKKGLGNRYAYSVSEADVNGTGLPTKFYFMKFNSDNTLATTITIPTDANGGTSYKIDDYAEVVVINTATGGKQFNLQKLIDDTNWFTPIYSTFDDQVDKGGAVGQSLTVPEWVAETTTYHDENGNKLRDDYVQYGWQGSSFTTRPVDKEGYDVRATPNYVAGEYDLDIPTSQKDGTLVIGTPYHKGDVIRNTRVSTRGTLYSQSTVIDDKGTIEYRAWFTYAKAAGTFSPDSKIDNGRVAAVLPPADYDFVTNPNHYTILDPAQMTLNQADESDRTNAGLAGQIVFQQLRFKYTNPAEHDATGNDNGKNNAPADADYNNLQKTYNYTILPYETDTWGRYDTGRTLTVSNPVKFPSLVNYVYWTQKATITYIDDTTGQILHVDDINGKIGTSSLYRPNSKDFSGNSEIGQDKPRTTKTISDYEKEGYVLVSNNYPADGAKFTDDNQVQNFEIHFAQGVQPVTPDTPTPDVPKNTPENAQPSALKKEVTLTVHYVNSDGTEFTGKIPANAKQTITFNGLAYVNKVTGELVNAKQVNNEWIVDKDNTATPTITWTPGDSRFKYVYSPEETGYYADLVSPDEYEDGSNVDPEPYKITKDSANIEVTVTYSPYTKVVNKQDVNASQIVKYVDEQGNELRAAKNQTFQFVYSGDTVNRDTNVLISKGKWNETIHNFDPQDVPVIDGYVAVKGYTRDDNDNVVAGGFTTTPEATEARRNRTYTVVYKKVGSIVPQDPNGNPIPDPSNPGQNVPNLPYTNDPIDPTKVTPDEPTPTIPGYTPNVDKVTPPDPTKDTPVVYTKNVEEKAKVQYIDLDENNRVMSESNTLTGKAGETINYSTADSIADYEKQGYVLVNDGFSDNPVFDNVDGNEQIFKVTFRHGRIPVGPDTPDKHGVDPSEVTKNVKETVHYVGAGDKTPADNVQTSKWTRTVTVDVVTGNVIADGQYTTDWSIAKGEKSVYDQVDTPIVEGYHADKRQVNATAVTQNDIEVTVTYTPNGKIIPVDPDGNPIPDVPTPQYPTDPTDPTKVTPDEPVPTIPGYTPSVPSVTPTDPGKDTPVPYNPVVPAKDQAAVINYVDADDNNKLITSSGTLAGKAGEKIKYSTAETIADLEKKGYVLVTNGFDPEGTAPVYDSDDNTTQVFTVVLKHGTVPVTPTDPGKPGEPISPDNPDIKWPEGTGENSLKKTGTQTIHYVYADGTKAKDDNVQSFDFTKSGVVDKVTGKLISETNWNVSSHTFGRVDSPVIEGYHADKRVAGGETVTPDDLSKEVTVTYTPNGKIIPVDPDGNPIPDVPTPQYPTDPTDPTKVTPDEPVPTIPGYTPSVPSVTPTDPGKDTPVPYNPVTPVVNDQNAVVNYVDQDNNNAQIATSGNLTGKAGSAIDYSTAATIKQLEDQGYVLVSDGFPTGAVFDNDDNTTQTYTVVLKHGTTTFKPDKPGTPGEPINPNYPDGPKVTNEDVDYLKDVKFTVHYVGAGAKNPADNVQNAQWTRSITVDNVTGKIISSTEWVSNKDSYNDVRTPVVEGYHADRAQVDGTTVTMEDQEVTVTYAPNGKIIPVDPNGNPIPNVPTPQYPTDPTDPTKVVPNEPVPTVPGYTPDVPTVTPTNPGEDTPVTYTPETPVVPTTPGDNGGENGNHTPSTPTDENNVTPEVPGTSTTPESKVDVPSQNGNKTSNQNTNTQASKQSAKALPQTGNERLKYEGLLGVLALGFAGLLTLGKKRRKEK